MGDLIVYSNWADGRIYRISAAGGEPRPLTPEGAWRYADLTFDRTRDRILAVREDHTGAGESVNTIVAVPLDGSGAVEVLVKGTDFVSSPRPSPDGTRLAWLTWNHPNMPWDGMDLWQARFDDRGRPTAVEHVAGSADRMDDQPAWSPEGVLHFASERSGWLQLYRRVERPRRAAHADRGRVREAGLAVRVGRRTPSGRTARSWAVARADGRDALWVIASGGCPRRVESPFTEIGGIRIGGDRAVIVGAGPGEFARIALLDLAATGDRDPPPGDVDIDAGPGRHLVAGAGRVPDDDGRTAHGLFYPPHGTSHFRAPAGELPPLVVTSHGGPTAAASSALSIGTQLLTSRGIAVAGRGLRRLHRDTAATTASGSRASGGSWTSTTA